MNQISSPISNLPNISGDLSSSEILVELGKNQASGCLQVLHNSLNYFIYFHRGKIAYATNSLEPFERLERHLRRLSHKVAALKGELRNSIRLQFETEQTNTTELSSDYQAVCWLVEQKVLTEQQAELLIYNLVREVLETYILLPQDSQKNFTRKTDLQFKIPLIDTEQILDGCRKQLAEWCSFCPHVSSSYQRPYFFSKPNATEEQQKIGKILRGFSFRQLAAVLNQDELVLLKKFYPLIANKTIVLRDPQPPFDLLPAISKDIIKTITNAPVKVTDPGSASQNDVDLSDISNTKTERKQWKIVCIDDSPTILNEISRFLDRDEFSVFPIEEPLKALMKIIRIQPDLILLDVGMPNIDGYKLCGLIRKYSAFKDTPIIMVTGNKGLIDRAKARMAGATDYMTKPFSQSDLLNIVFQYLS
jgi:two-component system, chemotaxis family, response regulator PixG